MIWGCAARQQGLCLQAILTSMLTLPPQGCSHTLTSTALQTRRKSAVSRPAGSSSKRLKPLVSQENLEAQKTPASAIIASEPLHVWVKPQSHRKADRLTK